MLVKTPDPPAPNASERGRVWLIGMPVEHSLSPAFQNAGFRQVGLAWDYVLRPVQPEELAQQWTLLREQPEVKGANVTVPYKEQAFLGVDKLGTDARLVGAVNTLVLDKAGLLWGHNTDVFGFFKAVEQWPLERPWSRALVLGAGGSSRAVVVALARLGATSITIANRSLGRAQQIVEQFSDTLDVALSAQPLDALDAAAPELVVHCTSLGVGAAQGSLPFEQARLRWAKLPWALWSEVVGVVDICYSPTQTPMEAVAHQLKVPSINGLDMLLYQGAQAFSLWTEREAPVNAMRDALYEAVERR